MDRGRSCDVRKRCATTQLPLPVPVLIGNGGATPFGRGNSKKQLLGQRYDLSTHCPQCVSVAIKLLSLVLKLRAYSKRMRTFVLLREYLGTGKGAAAVSRRSCDTT